MSLLRIMLCTLRALTTLWPNSTCKTRYQSVADTDSRAVSGAVVCREGTRGTGTSGAIRWASRVMTLMD